MGEFDQARAFGDEWWQRLVSYGVTRAVDAEFAAPPGFSAGDQGNLGYANGRYYTRGYPAPAPIAGNDSLFTIGAIVIGAGLLFVALKG